MVQCQRVWVFHKTFQSVLMRNLRPHGGGLSIRHTRVTLRLEGNLALLWTYAVSRTNLYRRHCCTKRFTVYLLRLFYWFFSIVSVNPASLVVYWVFMLLCSLCGKVGFIELVLRSTFSTTILIIEPRFRTFESSRNNEWTKIISLYLFTNFRLD